MAKNKNDMNTLIKNAIEASIDFELLMDSIDFNSYLEEEVDKEVRTSKAYVSYIEKTEKASKCLDKILNKIDVNVKEASFIPYDDRSRTQHLIFTLFEMKSIRLQARKSGRKEEEKLYIDATHGLHKAFDQIELEHFKCSLKGKNLAKDYNWAKVLYYNELAICYSGLAKSSMSLGYAEQSISILEKLYAGLKDLENLSDAGCGSLVTRVERKEGYLLFSHVLRLYTFALYNKGEAERLLHEEISALRTFQRITRIYTNGKKNNFGVSRSDYHSALLREALIFIDQGRGKEAINCFDEAKKAGFDSLDYRIQVCDLERASALIDQKEYEEAWHVLEKYMKESWDNTFTQRKAKVHMLRLLNEFRKNKLEDFQATYKLTKFTAWQKIKRISGVHYDKGMRDITITLVLTPENKDKIIAVMDKEGKDIIDKLWKKLHADNEISDVMKAIKEEYTKFEKNAKEILKKAAERQDWDNFKKACICLAEYYRYFKEGSEKALKCFYLYLFETPKKIYEDNFGDVIDDWLADKSLADLLKDYQTAEFYIKLDRTEDEKYLHAFFNMYVSDTKSELEKESKDIKTLSKRKKIVEKLKNRLESVFLQKDNDIELERVRKKHEDFLEGLNEIVRGEKGKPEKFIEDYFFKDSREGMGAESIVDQMERNTGEFVKNVVGTSKIHNGKKEKLKGRLSVLRRWNSFTPALSSPVNQSKGGGYFLHFSYKEESLGIVIDPGYDFLENFFSQGFKIGDIDVVLVSHAHPDHTDNLGSILSLFYEMNGRLGKYYHNKKAVNKKTLTLILSPGVFEHYGRIIKPSEEVLKDIIVVHAKEGEETEIIFKHPFKENEKIIVEIQAFGTSHKDLSQFQSLGFRIIAKENGTNATVIGYTGDAKWDKDKWPQYLTDCDIVCVHLGSIVNILGDGDFCNTFCVDYVKNDNDNKCKKLNECKKSGFENVNVTKAMTVQQIRKENHLYLAGLASFFDFMSSNNDRLKVGIVSEFGEELKNGIRIDLYKKFDACLSKEMKNLKCFPGDIGLQVDVFTGDVYCHCCGRFVERNGIEPIAYGKEEAICFVCEECNGVLSSYQIGEKLKNFCENGRTLESIVKSTNGGGLS